MPGNGAGPQDRRTAEPRDRLKGKSEENFDNFESCREKPTNSSKQSKDENCPENTPEKSANDHSQASAEGHARSRYQMKNDLHKYRIGLAQVNDQFERSKCFIPSCLEELMGW